MRHVVSLLLLAAFVLASTPARAADQSITHENGSLHCTNNKSRSAAMWYSIAHPGVGEWYLKGFGDFGKCPPKKFWLGFIPLYGWPGYLQVKSAIDAHDCKTNDDLTFRD